MTRPWLSVVMPIYNGERWLAQSLESICHQHRSPHDLEILIMDDGSTDATLRIAEQFSGRLPLQIHRLPRSGLWTRSVNVGLQTARGVWTCILHQDDVWKPERLAVLQRLTDRHPEADVLLHPSEFIDVDGHVLGRWRCPLRERDGFLTCEEVWSKLLVQNLVACCAPLFRTEAARSAGPMEEDLWYTADWDYWLRLTARSRTLYCPEILLSVRIHPESQTMQRAAGNGALREQYDKVLDRHLGSREAVQGVRRAVARRARYSAAINVALAQIAGGAAVSWSELLWQTICLGPVNTVIYLHDSAILSRVVSRMHRLTVNRNSAIR